MTAREKELEAIVRALVPAARDILWCALVWNDHNFGYESFMEKSARAAKALGYERIEGVDPVNAWLDRVERALARKDSA